MPRRRLAGVAARLARVGAGTLVFLLALWGALALALDARSRAAALGFLLLSAVLLVGRRARRVRRTLWALAFGLLLTWWLSLAPSNERDWQPDVAVLPGVRVEGERIAFTGVRDFTWTTDDAGEPRWEELSFALTDVVGAELVLSDWGAPLIVHTMLTFELAGGRRLVFSIETRKERGESYSAVSGLFRQYELYYVVGEERDVLGVRAAFRGEHLRLYPLVLAPEETRELLLLYARRIEELARRPAWYNALTASCTTSIRDHVIELGAAGTWNWRLLANGRVDELLYEKGRLDSDLPFAELRARSDVTAAAVEAYSGDESAFSARLRRDLPPRASRTR